MSNIFKNTAIPVLVVALFVLLQPSNAALGPAAASGSGSGCLENDGAVNYYQAGAVATAAGTSADRCLDASLLIEYHCSATGEPLYQRYACEYGCEEGACDVPK